MSIKIYEAPLPNTAFSTDGDMTNPVRNTFDGRTGGIVEKKYYVRSDDAGLLYSGVQVTPVDKDITRNIVNGSEGYSWKLKAGDTQPLSEEWQVIDEGNTVLIGNCFNTTTYLPFWVRIEVPTGAAVESFEDVALRLSWNEIPA